MNVFFVLVVALVMGLVPCAPLQQGDPAPAMVEFRMHNGDTLLCYTDGVELENGWDPAFGIYKPAVSGSTSSSVSYSFECTQDAVAKLHIWAAFEVDGITYIWVPEEVAINALAESPTIGA